MAFLTSLIRHPCTRSAPLRRLFATKVEFEFELDFSFLKQGSPVRAATLAQSSWLSVAVARRERCGIAARTANHQFLRGLRCVLLSSANRVLGVLAVKLRLNALSGVSARNTVALCARNARPRVAPHWCMGAAVRQPGRIQRGGVSLRSKAAARAHGECGVFAEARVAFAAFAEPKFAVLRGANRACVAAGAAQSDAREALTLRVDQAFAQLGVSEGLGSGQMRRKPTPMTVSSSRRTTAP